MGDQLQGKGPDSLLGLMDYLFIDGILFVSAMHFFSLCFSSTLATPIAVAAASVLDLFPELCPKFNTPLGRENTAQLVGGERNKEASTVLVTVIQ